MIRRHARLRSRFFAVLILAFGVLATACGGSAAEEEPVAASPPEAEEATAAGPEDAGTSTEETEAGAAPDCQELFDGETLNVWVPFSAGGGYDSLARLTAPYLEEELGASVVVENRPGAGGLLAVNSLMTLPGEGRTMLLMDGIGAAGASVAGDEGAQFELDELTYLGRLNSEPQLMFTGGSSPYESVDDVLGAEPFRFGLAGPGGADYVNASILTSVLDLNAEFITGFAGASESTLAVTQGEVDGTVGGVYNRIPGIEQGDLHPLILLWDERIPELPETPAVMELDMDDEERSIMESQLTLYNLGRVFVGPPDMPQPQAACLREAIQAVTENPELREAVTEQQAPPINYASGEELEQVVQDIQAAPESFVEVMEEAYGSE